MIILKLESIIMNIFSKMLPVTSFFNYLQNYSLWFIKELKPILGYSFNYFRTEVFSYANVFQKCYYILKDFIFFETESIRRFRK